MIVLYFAIDFARYYLDRHPIFTVLWLVAFATCAGLVAYETGTEPVDPWEEEP